VPLMAEPVDRPAEPAGMRAEIGRRAVYRYPPDCVAALGTLVRSTPQGRAVRLDGSRRRIEVYTAAADAVKDLAPEDRKLATAMLQLVHVIPWLERRGHWNLSGEQIAHTTGWAMRSLLADLRKRGDRPLDVEIG